MGFYTEPEIDELERKAKQGRSAIRWGLLAVIFLITAGITQIVWFIWILTENSNAKAAFVIMVGSFVLAKYCRWCANDARPEDWKR